MCGKNINVVGARLLRLGSPPRVREKLSKSRDFIVVVGITPACAGKTKIDGKLVQITGDHPRVCGKNVKFGLVKNCVMGSPPRVREKPEMSQIAGSWAGITPACAGKTLSRPRSQTGAWDHPRVCGKNLNSAFSIVKLAGSPPRVREKR